MNSSLKDLQADIQRLASRQQHIHHVLEHRPQSLSPQPPPQQQQQQQPPPQQQHQSEFYLHSTPHQPQQQHYISHQQQQQQPQQPNFNTYNPYNSAPTSYAPQQQQYQPTPPPRRTWASPNPMPMPMQQQQPMGPAGDGYMPHNAWMDPGRQNIPKYSQPQHYSVPPQNMHNPHSTPPPHQPSGVSFMLHQPAQNSSQVPYSLHNGSNSASPQHRNTLNRLSQMMGQQDHQQQQQHEQPHVTTVPIPGPGIDDPMAPQPIAFIGTPENRLTFNSDSGGNAGFYEELVVMQLVD